MNAPQAPCVGAMILAAACADGASDADPTDVAVPAGVACDAPLPGPRIDAVVESAEDYRARLDALDPAGKVTRTVRSSRRATRARSSRCRQ